METIAAVLRDRCVQVTHILSPIPGSSAVDDALDAAQSMTLTWSACGSSIAIARVQEGATSADGVVVHTAAVAILAPAPRVSRSGEDAQDADVIVDDAALQLALRQAQLEWSASCVPAWRAAGQGATQGQRCCCVRSAAVALAVLARHG